MADYPGQQYGFSDFERSKPSLEDEEIYELRELLSSRPTRSVTLPDLAATANDLFLPSDGLLFRIQTTGAPQTITGFANVASGRVFYLAIGGASVITLAHENAGSVAQNRIICPTVLGVALTPPAMAILIYDGNSQRWLIASQS